MDGYLTTREAAQALGVGVERVRQLARKGDLPAKVVGRRRFFSRESIEALLAARNRCEAPQGGLTAGDVSQMLGIDCEVVRHEIRRGFLRATKVDGTYLLTRGDVDDYIRDRESFLAARQRKEAAQQAWMQQIRDMYRDDGERRLAEARIAAIADEDARLRREREARERLLEATEALGGGVWYRLEDAASLLGVSRPRLRALVSRGIVGASLHRGRHYIAEGEVVRARNDTVVRAIGMPSAGAVFGRYSVRTTSEDTYLECPDGRRWLTYREAVAFLGISVVSLSYLLAHQIIPSTVHGEMRFVLEADAIAFAAMLRECDGSMSGVIEASGVGPVGEYFVAFKDESLEKERTSVITSYGTDASDAFVCAWYRLHDERMNVSASTEGCGLTGEECARVEATGLPAAREGCTVTITEVRVFRKP